MKKLIDNRNANFYLNAAYKFGLNYTILNNEIGWARIFKSTKTLEVSSNILSVNSQISGGLSENKVKTSILLQEKNIPVPVYQKFKDSAEAVKFAETQLHAKKSIVIKPINSSLSIGVTINPTNLTQIKLAVKEAFIGTSEIMIEEFIQGRHFRITVLDDEVIAITERTGAYITGDGKSSVAQLIQRKNNIRKKIKLSNILIRKKDQFYMKKNKIALTNIYPDGVKVPLQLDCDLDMGERIRIDRDSIPQINTDLFIRAAKALSLRFAGIDYITPDIMVPYTHMHTAINEINSAPNADVHFGDMYPNSNYAAERIIEKIFFGKTHLKPKAHAN